MYVVNSKWESLRSVEFGTAPGAHQALASTMPAPANTRVLARKLGNVLSIGGPFHGGGDGTKENGGFGPVSGKFAQDVPVQISQGRSTAKR